MEVEVEVEVEVEADSLDSVVAVEVSAVFSVAVVVDSVELEDSVEVGVVVAAAVSGFTAFAVRFRGAFLAFTFGVVVLDGLMFSCDFS